MSARGHWILRFLLGLAVIYGALALRADAPARPARDATGISMRFLVDDDGDPSTGYDVWVGDPSVFRFDRSTSLTFQVHELNSNGEWILTGWGTAVADVQRVYPDPRGDFPDITDPEQGDGQ